MSFLIRAFKTVGFTYGLLCLATVLGYYLFTKSHVKKQKISIKNLNLMKRIMDKNINTVQPVVKNYDHRSSPFLEECLMRSIQVDKIFDAIYKHAYLLDEIELIEKASVYHRKIQRDLNKKALNESKRIRTEASLEEDLDEENI